MQKVVEKKFMLWLNFIDIIFLNGLFGLRGERGWVWREIK